MCLNSSSAVRGKKLNLKKERLLEFQISGICETADVHYVHPRAATVSILISDWKGHNLNEKLFTIFWLSSELD